MILRLVDTIAERWLSWRSDRKIEAFAVAHPEYGLAVQKLEVSENGMIFGCVSPTFALVASEAAKMLDAAHATNYLQFDIAPKLKRDIRPVRVTIQWVDGMSPAVVNDKLKAACRGLLDLIDSAIADYKHLHEVREAKELLGITMPKE